MESLAIGMLLGAAFVCIAAFFMGMLAGDVDLSDVIHDNMKGYIKGSETDELYKMERMIVHEIVKRERREIDENKRSIYDSRTGKTTYYNEPQRGDDES